MGNKQFDIIVKKLLKNKNKLVDVVKLKNIVDSVLGDNYSAQKLYKLTYNLKNRGYLQTIKKNIYLIKDEDRIYGEQELLDLFYWDVVKKHCKQYLDSDWYIGGIKALEFNISSYDVPDDLLIVNRYKQAVEVAMLDKKITFKKYYVENKKLFSVFMKYTQKIRVKNNLFVVANLELSMLESLYNTPLLSQGYVDELIKKALRKYKKTFNLDIWKDILLNNKHHSSINRLYKLALLVDPDLAERIRILIKKFSYFVGV